MRRELISKYIHTYSVKLDKKLLPNMEEDYYVFQHSFAALTYNQLLTIEEIFTKQAEIDFVTEETIELIGDQCLFKQEFEDEGLYYGRITSDIDMVADFDSLNLEEINIYHFPKAEYLFYIHEGPFEEINTAYNTMQSSLEQKNLDAIHHPVLVFPKGIPADTKQPTVIEIWLATNANFSQDERLSDDLPEAIERKRFNFYTW